MMQTVVIKLTVEVVHPVSTRIDNRHRAAGSPGVRFWLALAVTWAEEVFRRDIGDFSTRRKCHFNPPALSGFSIKCLDVRLLRALFLTSENYSRELYGSFAKFKDSDWRSNGMVRQFYHFSPLIHSVWNTEPECFL